MNIDSKETQPTDSVPKEAENPDAPAPNEEAPATEQEEQPPAAENATEEAPKEEEPAKTEEPAKEEEPPVEEAPADSNTNAVEKGEEPPAGIDYENTSKLMLRRVIFCICTDDGIFLYSMHILNFSELL